MPASDAEAAGKLPKQPGKSSPAGMVKAAELTPVESSFSSVKQQVSSSSSSGSGGGSSDTLPEVGKNVEPVKTRAEDKDDGMSQVVSAKPEEASQEKQQLQDKSQPSNKEDDSSTPEEVKL